VDYIHEKYSKNTKIIAVTHIGYDVDKLLGEQTRGIYLVVGGHSHTLLGDMAGAEGPYPTIVKVGTTSETILPATKIPFRISMARRSSLSPLTVGASTSAISMSHTTPLAKSSPTQVDLCI
jgi:hypothetical protein